MPNLGSREAFQSGLRSRNPNNVNEAKQAFIDGQLDYRTIHSRRYCRDYHLPNDETEQLRQSLQHQAYLRVLGKAGLTSAPLPLPLNQPTHILDIGTGPGDWAIRMAEVYSPCRVTGTDISAIAQRENVPVNVNFVVEDAESWERASSSYDLIHFRGMSGAFRDWIYIYDCAFESLKPGGWVEVQDVSDLQLAAAKSGRKQDDAHLEPSLFWDTGFQEVTVSEHTVPLEATLGELWLITILDGIEAMALRLLTAHMGWRTTECREACERAARELAMLVKDPSNAGELNISIKTVIGRKPFVE